MKPVHLLRLVWWLAGLALVLGWARTPLLNLIPAPRELPRLDGATGLPWISGGFEIGNRYPEEGIGLLPPGMENATSWVGTDEWQGRAESAWFKASRRLIHVGIKGYPQHPGCDVWAEFRDAAGSVTRIRCGLTNPREQWNVWEIKRPAGAVAVRIVGEDRSSANAGWVAFSHPFRAWPGAVTAGYQWAQLITTTALALVLLWGPGLRWTPRRAPMELRLVMWLGLGPLLLVALGGSIWLLGGVIAPGKLGLALVAMAWWAIGGRGGSRAIAQAATRTEFRVLAVAALVTLAVVAKSAYSVGPQGELFRGTISRNMEMADRIDSRFSFYVVQAIAHHWAPHAPTTEKFFHPWTFFSRGPLAGLVTAPVVMATHGQPPTTLPEERWSPFDRTGFAAYRVTMIALSSSVILALFFVLVPLVGERWAAIAGGLLALTPFGVHELMFTWPKWAATAWLLASFALAHARRPAGAGLAMGVGFLFHPLVLLWVPWIALWAAGRGERRIGPMILTGARYGAGLAACVLPWMALGALTPHLPGAVLAGQSGFFTYWARADWQLPTWESWWRTRWMNFSNTFIPLHVYLSDASFNHHRLGSAYEASGRLVKFSQVWWNSLPFGLGLGVWTLSLVAMARAGRSLLVFTAGYVAAPALVLTAYWGMDPLGMMRECGHPLFVTIIALLIVTAARQGGWLRTILEHRAWPWLQLPETWLMLWLTALLNPAPWAVEHDQLDGLGLAINALALGGAAWVVSLGRRSSPTQETAPLPPDPLPSPS